MLQALTNHLMRIKCYVISESGWLPLRRSPLHFTVHIAAALTTVRWGVDHILHASQMWPTPCQTRKFSQTSAGKSLCCCLHRMCTRAVHLELVSSLSTDAFLAALKRFVSWRGLLTTIYSDSGTNFVGANREYKLPSLPNPTETPYSLTPHNEK